MAVAIGAMEPFSVGTTDWSTYYDRVEQYFAANNVAEDRQVATFLTLIGGLTYKLLADLVSPDKPKDKTLKELSDALAAHCAPKPLVIAERYRFHKRDQRQGESVNAYLAELRRLARFCEFGDVLDTTLRDRFVCGIRSQALCKVLLAEKDLTLKTAIEKANSLEVATRDASELAGSATAAGVHVLGTSQHRRAGRPSFGGAKSANSGQSRTSYSACFRCGSTAHGASECPFKAYECRHCRKTGHLRKVCKKRLAERSTDSAKRSSGSSACHSLAVDVADDDEFNSLSLLAADVLQAPAVATDETTPTTVRKALWIDAIVNGQSVRMQVDTGAAVSIIPSAIYRKSLSASPLTASKLKLRTYTGEPVHPRGTFVARVEYYHQSAELPLHVVDTQGPALCGRDLLAHIALDWQRLFQVEMADVPSATVSPGQQHPGSAGTRLEQLKEKFSDVFSDDFGKLKDAKARLQLKDDASPRFLKARPLPYAMRPKVEAELDRLEGLGIVSKVQWSEWATPIVPVMKPNGSVRLCGDFKATLNPHLKVDQHPLPRVEDVFATLAGGQRFTKIDLKQAYLQMEMDDASKPLLTLTTHKGLYQLNRLGFGVASAPALWQQAIDRILHGVPSQACLLDDIIVTGRNDDDHLDNVESILSRLSDHGLRVNPAKCTFFADQVEYCGHIVSRHGLRKTDGKVKAINEAPAPQNVSQLRSFLGMVCYYQRFLKDCSTTLHPLNNLLRKGQSWRWTAECAAAFKAIKAAIASDQVLMHFDADLPVQLATDASPYGLGAVLSHIMPDGTERPIAFVSRSLTDTEKRYAQIDKEALSIVWGVRKFHTYLFGRPFVLLTDHEPLTAIFSPSKGLPAMTTARLQRYAIFLASMNYEIKYRKSADHANADGLSRLPLPHSPQDGSLDWADVFNMAQIDPLPVTAAEIARHTNRDPVLAKVLTSVSTGRALSTTDGDMQPFVRRKDELGLHQGCVMWGIRVVIPSPLRHRVLEELHSGHPGLVRMKALARSFVWWPGIDTDIEQTGKACLGCQAHQAAPPKSPLHPWEWPSKPWQRLHIDFAGPFQGHMWLIVVDAHSKWPEVLPMSSTTAPATIRRLREVFAQHGLPDQIVSDNGPQFTADEFRRFTEANGITHTFSAPYHPATNGLAERFVRTMKQALRSHSATAPLEFLPRFLLAYRTTPHATTNATPASLLMHRELRTRLSLVQPSVQASVAKKQTAQRSARSANRERTFAVDDTVMVRDYRTNAPHPWIPGTVQAVHGSRHYTVEVGPDQQWRRHVEQLRSADSAPQSSVPMNTAPLPSVAEPDHSLCFPTAHLPASVPTPPSVQAAATPTPPPAQTPVAATTATQQVQSPLAQDTTEPRRNPPRARVLPARLRD